MRVHAHHLSDAADLRNFLSHMSHVMFHMMCTILMDRGSTWQAMYSVVATSHVFSAWGPPPPAMNCGHLSYPQRLARSKPSQVSSIWQICTETNPRAGRATHLSGVLVLCKSPRTTRGRWTLQQPPSFLQITMVTVGVQSPLSRCDAHVVPARSVMPAEAVTGPGHCLLLPSICSNFGVSSDSVATAAVLQAAAADTG